MGSSIAGKTAFDLFPDLFPDQGGERKGRPTLQSPPPPDISWLENGIGQNEARSSGRSATALVAIANDQTRRAVADILVKMGFAVHPVPSAKPAIQRLQAVRYQVVVCEADSAWTDLHLQIGHLPSARRRETFYGMVGEHLHTLSNIEALAFSANLVINSGDIGNLEWILGKGFSDNENLYRSFLDSLGVRGSAKTPG